MPMTRPVIVSRMSSATWAMPKSMSTGSPSTSSTLPGLTSRCTTPAEWMASRASASPDATRCRSAGASRPRSATWSSSEGPGHVAGDDVGGGAVDVGVDDRRDPRALDAGQGAHLAGQPGAGVGVVRDVLAQHLDGHRAAVAVEREVHHAHPTLAEALDQPVLTQPRVLARLLGLVVLRLGAVGERVGGHAHHGKASGWVDAGPAASRFGHDVAVRTGCSRAAGRARPGGSRSGS